MIDSSPPPRAVIGALDVGSNAIRLAIARIEARGRVVPFHRRREALRLGTDAFRTGTLAPETIDDAVTRLRSLRQLLRQHHVEHFLAVATSAARTASNGAELVQRAHEELDLELRIIDGHEEAALALLAVVEHFDLGTTPILLLDMGGGSVEVTLARDGRIIDTVSLPLGPVRLLERLRTDGLHESDVAGLIESQCAAATAMIAEAGVPHRPLICIGSGGNLESLAGDGISPLLGRATSERIELPDLDRISDRLAAMPVDRRISQLGLEPDRADLIEIAAIVVTMLMRAAGIETMLVPGVSLIDGVLMRAARVACPAARGPRRPVSISGDS